MSSSYSDQMCELVELYALDGLEEHEKVAFEHHLTGCAVCRNQLIELRLVVHMLPVASDPVKVPDGMRERVLGKVLDSAALNEGSSMTTTDAEEPELSRRATYYVRAERKAGTWRWVSLGLAAAVLGLSVYSYELNRNVSDLRSELAVTDTKLADVSKELVKVGKPAEALKVNKIVNLSPAAENFVSKGLAAIVIDAKGTHLIVQAEDLPQIKQEEAFQVWLIKDNQPVNAGTFYPQNGKGAIYYTFEPKEYDTVAITLEPDAHGEKPRGTIVLTAGLIG
jgi:hypothetical protein